MIGPLRSLETIETLPSRRIFQAIFALDEAGGRVGFDEINGRLEEADQNLLAQAVLNEDGEVSREEVVSGDGEHAAQRTAASSRALEDAHRRIGARRPA